MISAAVQRRVWARVAVTDDADGCWLWTGDEGPTGYGQYAIVSRGRRKMWRAHRLVFTMANGEIPAGLVVMHKCDVPLCVRPRHLALGTSADNAADMATKGRGRNGFSGATHCVNGHPFDEVNTARRAAGGRACRECRRALTRRWRAAKRSIAAGRAALEGAK